MSESFHSDIGIDGRKKKKEGNKQQVTDTGREQQTCHRTETTGHVRNRSKLPCVTSGFYEVRAPETATPLPRAREGTSFPKRQRSSLCGESAAGHRVPADDWTGSVCQNGFFCLGPFQPSIHY